LAGEPDFEVLAAGRRADAPLRLDAAAPDFAQRLAQARPDIVIHCAGPFQGQDYRVARASVAAGAHYIDLADGRDFVASFPAALHGDAVAAGRLAVSGASTLPALSSAVVDELARRYARIDEVHVAIAPGQRAARGAATIAGVLSYCGRPFKWLSDGKWTEAWGWQELSRLRFAGAGSRWAAACDVPDLELFPARYPGLRTMRFRAALEFGAQHFALWLAGGLRRCGVPLALERWARPLDRLASALAPLGGEKAGMLVSVSGQRNDGRRTRTAWHLTVEAAKGPEIPCLAAILLARRVGRGGPWQPGAFACMGFLALADFAPEFRRLGIVTAVEEQA
ncbi:MAG TPA: saccharopine dehydrogenase, partial [Burkholderiales bacterium]|nr:saccharopine dehydrogenase [Burkholderiales bacterium]